MRQKNCYLALQPLINIVITKCRLFCKRYVILYIFSVLVSCTKRKKAFVPVTSESLKTVYEYLHCRVINHFVAFGFLI